MSRPTRDSPAGRAYLDLQNRARAEKRGTQELLTLYAVERWLARFSASPYANQFILKGGMLLASLGARRPTPDADTLARDFANDEATVVARVIDIATQPTVLDDGIVFLVHGEIASDPRRRALLRRAHHDGLRSRDGKDQAAPRYQLRDPVTPEPELVDLPALREGDLVIPVLGYPIETVLAEKIATAIALGPANTRVRDFADVYTLTGMHSVTHAATRGALLATAAHRETTLVPLSDALGNLVEFRARTYVAYRSGLGPDGAHLPDDFDVVVRAVATFADRLIEHSDEPLRWNPRVRDWEW